MRRGWFRVDPSGIPRNDGWEVQEGATEIIVKTRLDLLLYDGVCLLSLLQEYVFNDGCAGLVEGFV